MPEKRRGSNCPIDALTSVFEEVRYTVLDSIEDHLLLSNDLRPRTGVIYLDNEVSRQFYNSWSLVYGQITTPL